MIVHDDRKLATVRSINQIAPIEGADRIVLARIDGWTVVVQKAEFREGDKIVFFEIDSALPVDRPEFAHLNERGTKFFEGDEYHVLKTIRLKGVYSQGLAIPIRVFADSIHANLDWDGDPLSLPHGFDLTKILGIGKWETPVAVTRTKKDVAGRFLTEYARKTDSERVQNMSEFWDEVSSVEWYATEKIDGTSLTVARDMEGNLRVMSRNLELKEGDNLYWNVVRDNAELFDALSKGEVIQAEVAGPGIQSNPLALPSVRVFVFDFIRNRQPLPRSEWPQVVLDSATPVLDIPFPESPEQALSQVEKLKTVAGTSGKQTEGVVWHTVDGSTLNCLDNRSTWKAINNSFLQKHSGQS